MYIEIKCIEEQVNTAVRYPSHTHVYDISTYAGNTVIGNFPYTCLLLLIVHFTITIGSTYVLDRNCT